MRSLLLLLVLCFTGCSTTVKNEKLTEVTSYFYYPSHVDALKEVDESKFIGTVVSKQKYSSAFVSDGHPLIFDDCYEKTKSIEGIDDGLFSYLIESNQKEIWVHVMESSEKKLEIGCQYQFHLRHCVLVDWKKVEQVYGAN
jgi:hypothetical protein